jgi:uncharacterized protein (TIGR00730 family)
MKIGNKNPPKAYKNLGFLAGKDARPVRILAEFLEPLSRFRYFNVKDTVVFFGSARIRSKKDTTAELRKINALIKKSKKPPKVLLESQQRAKRAVEMSDYYEDAVELARIMTSWSKSLKDTGRFVVCSGGGPGIMEAANRGATLAKGRSLGLGISLPMEQFPNKFITPELNLEFHYFFMRKYWFMYLGKALIAFPGGFGTMDELMELLTLLQTGKIRKKMTVILYGRKFWDAVVNLKALYDMGMISKGDFDLFSFADSPLEAFEILKKGLTKNYLPPDQDEL